MPTHETKQLLRAIEDFSEAYAGDEMFKATIEQLGGVRSEIEQIATDTEEASPGQEAARAAAADEREKPRALRAAEEPAEKGEAPRSYAEASTRARERFPDKASARAEGPDAPGTARETA